MLSMIVLLAACTGDQEFTALKPSIAVFPEVLDFGEVIEDYSLPGVVEIQNVGQGVLEIDEIVLNGDGAAAFTLGEVPVTVAAGESYDLDVTFLPPQPLPYTGSLSIHSNDELNPAVLVTLAGQGIEAPTPDIECDPLAIDFGTVISGSFAMEYFTCTNVGGDDLYISNQVQGGGGAFVVQSDLTGDVLPPGQDTQIVVAYTPNSDVGDNGTITLSSNDPDEPDTLLTMVGNGGGDFQYPVAVLDCVTNAVPRETVTVDGGGSEDPQGYAIVDYLWTVTGPYDDIDYQTGVSDSELYVQLELAGTYNVSLQVVNSIGLVSAPTICRIDAIPEEQLHVELVWEDSNDMDLHLVNGSGTLFDGVNDCNYCNINPEWGASGADDNPILDLDAWQDPPGVENINIDTPAEDVYSVKVHYYEASGAGDVVATVNIYLYGVLEESYSRVMSRNKVWDVAQIVWPEGYVVEETTDLYTPEYRYCE